MKKLIGCFGCLLLLAFYASESLASSVGSGLEKFRGLPNPDPGNIIGVAGEEVIGVRPRNDALDYRNLQWAVDNTAPGGKIRLDAGTFFLGDGQRSPRKTVVIRRGLCLIGKKEGGTWRTIIRGGGEVMTPGVGGALESGPFRIVNESDNHPVDFEDIWFRDWACEVVFIEACQGFVFRGCRISHPANRNSPGVRFVHAIWTSGAKARGDFTVANNLVELSGYENQPADDEQLLGVFYSNHDTIRVVNNLITGMDEAIEIIGNRTAGKGIPAASGPAEIIVSGNRIDVTSNPGQRWPSSFAILVAGNLGADAVRIEGNYITTRGKGLAFGLSGDKLNIAGNRIRFEEHNGEYPPGAVTIGFGMLGPYNMGASLTNSQFMCNTFEGKISGNALVFRKGTPKMPNRSHGNFFDLGDSLAKLGGSATLLISKDVYENTFKGDLGTLIDNSPACANGY